MPKRSPRVRRSEHPERSKRKTYGSSDIEDLFMDSDDADMCDSDADDEEDKAQAIAEGRLGRESKRLNVYSNSKLRGSKPSRTRKLVS